MPQIILDEEQTKVVAAALAPVEVCDAKGNLLGFLTSGWSAEELAEAERALHSDQPGYTYAEVQAHLQKLVQP